MCIIGGVNPAAEAALLGAPTPTHVVRPFLEIPKNHLFEVALFIISMYFSPRLAVAGLRLHAKMVATPGRLVDLIADRRVDLASVCLLVVDEADKVTRS